MSSDGWKGDDADEAIDAPEAGDIPAAANGAEPSPRVITLRPPAMPRTAALDIPAPTPIRDAEMVQDDEPYDEVFAQLRPTHVPVPARSGTTLRPPAPILAPPESPPAAHEPPAADVEPPTKSNEATVVPSPRAATPRWILPGILITAALVIVYVMGNQTRDTTLPPESSVVTHAAEPDSARSHAPASSSAPARPPPRTHPRAVDLKQCVDSVLPLGPSIAASALDSVCSEADAKQLVAALSTLIVGSAGVPRNTQVRWASLGSFQMAGAQLLRSRCCGNDAATLVGPASVPICKLDAALARINDAMASGGELSAASQTYFKALDCLFKTKLFAGAQRPQAFEQNTFLELATPTR